LKFSLFLFCQASHRPAFDRDDIGCSTSNAGSSCGNGSVAVAASDRAVAFCPGSGVAGSTDFCTGSGALPCATESRLALWFRDQYANAQFRIHLVPRPPRCRISAASGHSFREYPDLGQRASREKEEACRGAVLIGLSRRVLPRPRRSVRSSACACHARVFKTRAEEESQIEVAECFGVLQFFLTARDLQRSEISVLRAGEARTLRLREA
jgi:hypothetical protein